MKYNEQYCVDVLAQLAKQDHASAIFETKMGLEKESLRVAKDGLLAQTPHPEKWGAALTHPYFTTDYSESMPELITPPFTNIKDALDFLQDLHHFAYQKLGSERLWATSMPCVVSGETSIPLAKYGRSNAGLMKTAYRRGLGHRYGRTMQVISGVHVNFSFSDIFWHSLKEMEGGKGSTQAYIDSKYFAMLRNLQRIGWLIPYLFGASPSVCESFLSGHDIGNLEAFDEYTYYEPYATSLRMGDIGYQNNKENELGFKANYDNVDSYIESLESAIRTPSDEYKKIPVIDKGKYQQLNANMLQIENEYYSTVRPKQIPARNERPTQALKKRGVAYVELRSVDVNVFTPVGVDKSQLNFIKVLMFWTALIDSPNITTQEQKEIDDNELLVAHQGRKPNLKLDRKGKKISLKAWASELFLPLRSIAKQLDEVEGKDCYTEAVEQAASCVDDPEKTPSAKMLKEMRDKKEGFHHFARRYTDEYYDYFTELSLPIARESFFNELAKESIKNQHSIEQADQISFEKYLENYYE